MFRNCQMDMVIISPELKSAVSYLTDLCNTKPDPASLHL